MKIKFFKLQGTGNDFIIIDFIVYQIHENIINPYNLKKLCNRNFGIGADGIIFIQKDLYNDFYMKYYNSDGNESTMCGNGGRCSVLYFCMKNKKSNISFNAIDGTHSGVVNDEMDFISVSMNSIKKKDIIINDNEHILIDTGSPHYILFVDKLSKIDVIKEGRRIRFNNLYSNIGGVNVNFVNVINNNIYIRTYERGVENETLSCGTGAIASVISSYYTNKIKKSNNIFVYTIGGKLVVDFKENKNIYENIYLSGPSKIVFTGFIYTNELFKSC